MSAPPGGVPGPRGQDGAAAPEPQPPVLLLADDRATSFTRYAARAAAGRLVLLRFAAQRRALSPEYVRETAHLPAFWIREGVPPAEEARRYRAWAAELPAAPTRFCNPSEPQQETAQEFAALAGLPHLTRQQVRWVRDKAAMKARFRELGLATAAWRRVRAPAEVLRFAGRYGWPLVLKPVDSFACIDTHRLDGPAALDGVDWRAREWMAEEFLTGTEWEACALIHGGRVLDAWPSAMPCRPLEIVSGAMNANISVATGAGPPVDLPALVQRITTGMGIDHGYLHMEFFERDGTVFASEVGLRMAGCEIAANHGHAYGFDIFGATLDVYRGRRPELRYRHRRCVGDLLLPLPGSGVVRHITPAEQLRRIPGTLDVVLQVGAGDTVHSRRASHSASGHVHVAGDSVAQVERRMRAVLDAFTIELAPLPHSAPAAAEGGTST
ncbi:ATP-dependent carboxylate-amine ligase [Streptomyces qinglanensis]|uniref:ATP-dependent carboxylate-amine ligase n=1 Tax=Streptomyces qinglanensis TaxID=943816 RepID=UPI00379155A8